MADVNSVRRKRFSVARICVCENARNFSDCGGRLLEKFERTISLVPDCKGDNFAKRARKSGPHNQIRSFFLTCATLLSDWAQISSISTMSPSRFADFCSGKFAEDLRIQFKIVPGEHPTNKAVLRTPQLFKYIWIAFCFCSSENLGTKSVEFLPQDLH